MEAWTNRMEVCTKCVEQVYRTALLCFVVSIMDSSGNKKPVGLENRIAGQT